MGDSGVCGGSSSFLTNGSGSMWMVGGSGTFAGIISSLISCSSFTVTGEFGGGGVGILAGSSLTSVATGDNGGYSTLMGEIFDTG